jgi:hypothetical protein
MGSSLSSDTSYCLATHSHVVFTISGENTPRPSHCVFSLKISGNVERTSALAIETSTSGKHHANEEGRCTAQ